jgi:hypothetical protein
MNVIVTVSRAERGAYMKTFTIDADNNISVFTSKKEAAAASATSFDRFTSQSELAELATDWPMARLVEIWNSIPGVTAVTKVHQPKERACGPTSSGETSRKSNSLGVDLQQGRSWQCYALLHPSASVLSGFWKAALMNAPANLVTSLAALATCA